MMDRLSVAPMTRWMMVMITGVEREQMGNDVVP